MRKYPVITLCGSTRFKKEFEAAQKELTFQGNIVISVGLFGHSGDSEVWKDMAEGAISDTKRMLDDMHKRKIDMADRIYVVNPGGYIGDSTWSEICYARMLEKGIDSMERISEQEIDRRVASRIDAAERRAWEQLDGLRHQGEYADFDKAVSFKYKGNTIYDPWISPEAHVEAIPWADHKDSTQAVDPFGYYGKKNMAVFIADILIGYEESK